MRLGVKWLVFGIHRDLGGLWTEGGLIALDKDLNELGRVVGLPYVFSSSYYICVSST